jgi:hypothetical protein
MTTPIKPVPAEQVPEKDGLIHGVSAAELQSLCEKCIEAKATAYCKCPTCYHGSATTGRGSLVQQQTIVVPYCI